MIDFRPDSTCLDGFCITGVYGDSEDQHHGEYLGTDEECSEQSPAAKRILSSKFGLNLESTTVGRLIFELLLLGDYTDPKRWNPIKPVSLYRREKQHLSQQIVGTRDYKPRRLRLAGYPLQYEVHLGGKLLHKQPVIAGGVTFTDNFDAGRTASCEDMTGGNTAVWEAHPLNPTDGIVRAPTSGGSIRAQARFIGADFVEDHSAYIQADFNTVETIAACC